MPVHDEFYHNVERAKEKARRLVGQVIAVNQNTSIVIGNLTSVDLERLFTAKYPYCKLTIDNGVRFNKDQTFGHKLGDTEFVFITKPDMVMNAGELERSFPKIHTEVSMKTRRDEWW